MMTMRGSPRARHARANDHPSPLLLLLWHRYGETGEGRKEGKAVVSHLANHPYRLQHPHYHLDHHLTYLPTYIVHDITCLHTLALWIAALDLRPPLPSSQAPHVNRFGRRDQ